MSIRGIGSAITFLFVFLGLMSMVGQVHVGEFFGIIGIGTIAAVIAFFKLPKPGASSASEPKDDV